MIDLENLAKEFNIESDKEDFKIDIEKNLDNIDIDDTDKILKGNLARANALLDRLILEMNAGNFSPRMVEVSSQVMGIISDISKQIHKKTVDFENLQLKRDMLELKIKSMRIKGEKTVNQNIIVTDRETLLKLLKEQKDKKMIENKENFYDG